MGWRLERKGGRAPDAGPLTTIGTGGSPGRGPVTSGRGRLDVRATVCRSFDAPPVAEELELRRPGPGEVLVRVAACAICHSDLTYRRGGCGGPLPAVFGHEAAGLVEEVGDGVGELHPGEAVVVTSCGVAGAARRAGERSRHSAPSSPSPPAGRRCAPTGASPSHRACEPPSSRSGSPSTPRRSCPSTPGSGRTRRRSWPAAWSPGWVP